ncbi:hypothetical protein NX059_011180 [Plenodomus lindquistii]|nr:hypothetical protein NX059_011180 [Plenodomus lindquistii]
MTVPPASPEWCTEVGPQCTVEGSLYGYYPSIGANGFFLGFFALCMLLQIALGVRYKTWTFSIAMAIGCLGEVIGYAGRIMLYNNPFDEAGFQMQIVCLITAPAFFSAAIYLTLKHLVINLGKEWSRLRPAWYTYIFISADLISLTLQGAGGGMAASADNDSKDQDVGTDLMIAGVIFQVVILAVFAYFCLDYAVRTYRRRNQVSPKASALLRNNPFRAFVGAVAIAFISILIRCIYRIPELTGGWRSELMRNETDFIVLEGVMIALTVFMLTVFHPGFCFPALANTITRKQKVTREKPIDESSSGEVV